VNDGVSALEVFDDLALVAIAAASRGRDVYMRRNDAGHEGEYVPDKVREAFWDTNSLGERTLVVVLTEHSWAPVADVVPRKWSVLNTAKED